MPRQYPVMLYLDYLTNFAVAHNQDEYDKLVEQGYTTHDKVKPEPEPKAPVDVEDALCMTYEEIERLEDENTELKELNAELTMDFSGRDMALKGKDELIAEFKEELSKSSTEVAELTERLTVYESAKDANQDGVVSYDEMTSSELQALLRQRSVSFKSRDSKDVLIKLAQDSE